MKEYKRPLPITTFWSQPFWEGCKRHELLIQQCKICNAKLFYPKLFCPSCLSSELGWIKSGGKGKVYSYTTVYGYQPEAFTDDIPYILAVIRLEEGVQMMSRIVDCKPEDVKCDMNVVVVFKDVTDEFTLPMFKPLLSVFKNS